MLICSHQHQRSPKWADKRHTQCTHGQVRFFLQMETLPLFTTIKSILQFTVRTFTWCWNKINLLSYWNDSIAKILRLSKTNTYRCGSALNYSYIYTAHLGPNWPSVQFDSQALTQKANSINEQQKSSFHYSPHMHVYGLCVWLDVWETSYNFPSHTWNVWNKTHKHMHRHGPTHTVLVSLTYYP